MEEDRPTRISREAEREGTCLACGDTIEPGEVIVFDREHEVWVHEDCVDWE